MHSRRGALVVVEWGGIAAAASVVPGHNLNLSITIFQDSTAVVAIDFADGRLGYYVACMDLAWQLRLGASS